MPSPARRSDPSTGTTPLTTNAAGEVVFSDLSEDHAGSYSLAASATNLTSVTSTGFTISAATATARPAFVTQPSNTTAGAILNPITVRVADQYGNIVAGASVNIGLVAGSLSTGTTPLTTGNTTGLAVFGDLSENHAGTYTLTASTGSSAGVNSNSFTIRAVVSSTSHLAFVNQVSNVTAGATFSPVTVKVTDTYGNPIIGSSVSLGISTPGHLGTTQAPVTTNAAGQAVFGSLTETLAGTFSLVASVSGVTPASSNTFTVTAAAASRLQMLSEPTSTTAGSVIHPITVQAVDQYGNYASGTAISIAISPGTLSSGTTPLTANSAGQVVFNDLIEDKVGTYTLVASAPGVASVPSRSFTIIAAHVSGLTFVTQPSSVAEGGSLGSVTVLAADQYGNGVVSIPVSISLGSNGLGGITSVSTNTSGRAIFNNLSVRRFRAPTR